jgi:hypothetical protein
LANNETAPATSNRANKIFAFMGVLKKQEQDVCLVAMRPTPFKRTCDQSYWQESSKLAGGVSWANWFRDMPISHAAAAECFPQEKRALVGIFWGPNALPSPHSAQLLRTSDGKAGRLIQ